MRFTRTNRPTDGRTDPHVEMLGRIKSGSLDSFEILELSQLIFYFWAAAPTGDKVL